MRRGGNLGVQKRNTNNNKENMKILFPDLTCYCILQIEKNVYNSFEYYMHLN